MDFTPKQSAALRGLTQHRYIQLSATEAGDSEIQALFSAGLVQSYWGGGVMWHLTADGLAAAASLSEKPDEASNI